MKAIFVWGCLLAVLIEPCMSDVYLHNPPGSNNRLNGNRDNVLNANRLFDSQNNGKAGYNVGDAYHGPTGVNNFDEFKQLPMEYYMSGCEAKANTEVEIMWTNQHGTGPKTDDRVESQIILQYMCQEFPEEKFPGFKLPNNAAGLRRDFEYHTIRNGKTSAQQRFVYKRNPYYVNKEYGLHEPLHYYQAYYGRDRNKGLFTADQKLRGDQAIYTRQNPVGTRRGYEVPEERDYYPYSGPTPWNDIAIMVSNKKTEDLMKKYVNSPEYGYKYLCIMRTGNPTCPRKIDNQPAIKCVAKYITEKSCRNAGGEWTKFITNYLEKNDGSLNECEKQAGVTLVKGLPYEPYMVSQGADGKEQYVVRQKSPDVIYAPSTVVNHNGMSMDGKFSSYKWKVPCFPTNTTQRCVLRIRYNITTADVPREYDASKNDKVKNDPKTKAVDGKTDLQLALNTAQLGRTFQDRSHVFLLIPRTYLPPKYQNLNIYYISGVGKRGNIVQTYPAMEYRFTPERLTVTTNDVVCFVWSGSNNNPNNRAGEGKQGTDRTNVCWVKEGCSSLKPAACSSLPLEVVDQVDEFSADKLNLHLNKGCHIGNNLQAQLDNAPASCNPPCFRIKRSGEYCYMSTRNNNFSNRRHMGQITVTKP